MQTKTGRDRWRTREIDTQAEAERDRPTSTRPDRTTAQRACAAQPPCAGCREHWTAAAQLTVSLAGLAHSAYLILFALVGAFEPMAPPSVYIPADIVYGIVQGLIVAFAIPQLGSGSSFRQQLIRSACAGGVSALTAVPYVFSVSPAEPIVLFLSRLLNAFLLPFGVGLALSRRGSRRQTE